MHELSIALSILDVVEEEMQQRNGAQIAAIHVRLGPLSGVVKEALLSAYELAREQTSLARSRLIFEDVPIAVFCTRCQAERPVHSVQQFRCAECDTPATELRSGRELEVAALELEE
jgi:hydrogenase nickel incorporation protein HypA/HybF